MAPRLTVVIPTVERVLLPENVTLRTLEQQTFKDMMVLVVHDTERRGANWARNRGFERVSTELVMFCDDDIEWQPDALQYMINFLDANPTVAYVYCGYQFDKSHRISMQPFDRKMLMRLNYISTMSIIRTEQMPEGGFDENIRRFQDWDLWLTMLHKNLVGIWCGRCLYTTARRPGITHGNSITPQEAERAIMEKHKWIRHALQFIR